jgi:predicted TIM-barrel fold metal-dependent hydrolase
MIAICPPPDPDTRTPKFPVPTGACDTHAHVFGPMDRYKPAEMRRYDPPDCGIGEYRRMLDALGVARGILVQSSAYGTDNAALLDAIAEGGGEFRGVVLIRPEVSDRELGRLHEAGVRGVRAATLPQSHVGPEHMEALAARIADMGWVMQVHLQTADHMAELAPLFRRLPTPVLIDHLGRVRGADGIIHPGFRALLDLLAEDGKCWAKLCSFYRLSDLGHPDYADMAPAVRALVAAAPDRLVWGTNWPHPNHHEHMPNDGDLFDLLFGWIDDRTVHRKILVDNPARLFGFPPAPGSP